jgi:hypothetical protein
VAPGQHLGGDRADEGGRGAPAMGRQAHDCVVELAPTLVDRARRVRGRPPPTRRRGRAPPRRWPLRTTGSPNA